MTENEKQARVQAFKSEATAAKDKLFRIMDELRDVGGAP